MAQSTQSIPAAPSRDYPALRYASTLEPVGSRWLAVEAIGVLETPISGDDLTRLRGRNASSN